MNRIVKYLFVASCCGLLAIPLSATSPATPPKPPVGWMDNLTPGFDPSLEVVVVNVHDARSKGGPKIVDPMIDGAWKSWNEDAVNGLVALFEGATWDQFDDIILQILIASPYPSVWDYFERSIRDTPTDNVAHRRQSKVLPWARRYDAERTKQLCTELLLSSPETHGGIVSYGLMADATAADIAKIRQALPRMREIDRENIERRLEYDESITRANEPMERILSIERERKP